MLFGKRRAYQKKVAIAPFDGIFSVHGMVLRPKENVIDKDFFPLFIASDYFLDATIKISVGSLSPTINWRDLKELKFTIPPLSEQKKLAGALWSIVATMESYKKLLAKTDEMVKAKFVEMITNSNNINKEKINMLCKIVSGGTPDTKHPEYYGGDIPWISTVALGPNYIDETSAKDFLTKLGIEKNATHLIKKGTLLFGNRVGVGKTSITNCDMCTNQDILALTEIDKTKVNLLYLKNVLAMKKDYFNTQKRGATIKGIPIDVLGNISIPLPSLTIQNDFSTFVQKSEESKAAVQASLYSLTKLYKKIIAENLGDSN